MIIDATDLIVGRLATVAAKKALLGEEITIVNCEKAIVTGKRASTFTQYKERYNRGIPAKGPYIPRLADRFVRRTVRGMLPYKQPKGRDAFKRIMCYRGMPEEFASKKPTTIKEAHVSKIPHIKYVSVGEICKNLGGKDE